MVQASIVADSVAKFLRTPTCLRKTLAYAALGNSAGKLSFAAFLPSNIFAPRPSQGGTFNQGLLGVPASYRALAGSVYVAPLDGSTQGQGLLPKNAGFDAR